MSNLWAVLVADEGTYSFERGSRTVQVNSLNQNEFDRYAGKYPFCPVAFKDGKPGKSGVLWVRVKGKKALDTIRGFYRPPTVLYVKGVEGVALWAIHPTRIGKVMDANERFARLFKGRVMDAGPLDFRMSIAGCRAEWNTSAYYEDFDELVSRV